MASGTPRIIVTFDVAAHDVVRIRAAVEGTPISRTWTLSPAARYSVVPTGAEAETWQQQQLILVN